jgi:hypothetical protein
MDDSEITPGEAALEGATDQCDVTQLDGGEMAALLERIPGARERIELGIADARADRTIALEDL